MLLLLLGIAIVVLLLLGIGFLVLVKLGVIFHYAAKEEPADQGDYRLDQSHDA